MASVCFGWHSLSVVLSCEIFENTLQAGTNKNLTTSVSILWARASFGTSVNNALTTKSPLPVHLAMVRVVNVTGWDSPTTLNKAELRASAEERAEIIAWELWPSGLIHRWLQNLLRPIGSWWPWFPSATPFLSASWRPWVESLSLGLSLAWSYTPVHELNPLKPRARIKSPPSRLFLPGIFVTAVRTVTERKESASTPSQAPSQSNGTPNTGRHKVQSPHFNPVLFGLLSRFYSTTY